MSSPTGVSLVHDFVALLLAALTFCLGYWIAGTLVRLAVRHGLGHAHLQPHRHQNSRCFKLSYFGESLRGLYMSNPIWPTAASSSDASHSV